MFPMVLAKPGKPERWVCLLFNAPKDSQFGEMAAKTAIGQTASSTHLDFTSCTAPDSRPATARDDQNTSEALP